MTKGDTTTDWNALKNKFQALLDYCKESTSRLDHNFLLPSCKEAGKGAYELIQSIALPIEFHESLNIEPVVSDEWHNKDGESMDVEHYELYWLCVLGFLGRTDNIIIVDNHLRETKVPRWSAGKVEWRRYYHDVQTKENFFKDDVDYLLETCRASIQTCKLFISVLHPEAEQAQSEESTSEGRSKIEIDGYKQTIFYKGEVIRFSGQKYWQLFEMLFQKSNDSLTFGEIDDEFSRSDSNIFIGELRAQLRKQGKEAGDAIATAIVSQRGVGYRLDQSAL